MLGDIEMPSLLHMMPYHASLRRPHFPKVLRGIISRACFGVRFTAAPRSRPRSGDIVKTLLFLLTFLTATLGRSLTGIIFILLDLVLSLSLCSLFSLSFSCSPLARLGISSQALVVRCPLTLLNLSLVYCL